MFALCAVGVMLVALHVLTGFTRRLTAGQPGHSSKELLGVVVIGGGHFVARGLDGAVFEDLDGQFVDLHGLILSGARWPGGGRRRSCSTPTASRIYAPGSPLLALNRPA